MLNKISEKNFFEFTASDMEFNNIHACNSVLFICIKNKPAMIINKSLPDTDGDCRSLRPIHTVWAPIGMISSWALIGLICAPISLNQNKQILTAVLFKTWSFLHVLNIKFQNFSRAGALPFADYNFF